MMTRPLVHHQWPGYTAYTAYIARADDAAPAWSGHPFGQAYKVCRGPSTASCQTVPTQAASCPHMITIQIWGATQAMLEALV